MEESIFCTRKGDFFKFSFERVMIQNSILVEVFLDWSIIPFHALGPFLLNSILDLVSYSKGQGFSGSISGLVYCANSHRVHWSPFLNGGIL